MHRQLKQALKTMIWKKKERIVSGQWFQLISKNKSSPFSTESEIDVLGKLESLAILPDSSSLVADFLTTFANQGN